MGDRISDNITEQEEATLASATLAAAAMIPAEEVAKQMATLNAYMAMTSVLLDEPTSESPLHYLRGLAFIGETMMEESEPHEVRLHERVMATLAVKNVAPLTAEEFDFELRAAAQSLTHVKDAQKPDAPLS